MLVETGIKWTLEDARKTARILVLSGKTDKAEYGKVVREDGREFFAVMATRKTITSVEFRDDTHTWKWLGTIVKK